MQAYAIPAPIVPPPTTPIFVMSAGWFSILIGSFAARSAKNICRNARAWGSVRRVRNALRSCCMAVSNGNSEPSFAISSARLGAFWPTMRSSIFWVIFSAMSWSQSGNGNSHVGTRHSKSSVLTKYAASVTSSSISWIKPIDWAVIALIGLPKHIMSRAVSRSINRGNLCVPPAPGITPKLTSGNPICALGCMIRIRHANAISAPPPKAIPFIAAIHGTKL